VSEFQWHFLALLLTFAPSFAFSAQQVLFIRWQSCDSKLRLLQYAFVIKFPPGHLHHKEAIKIGFENEGTAKEWQVSLKKPPSPDLPFC
jgi:hypothetical protein